MQRFGTSSALYRAAYGKSGHPLPHQLIQRTLENHPRPRVRRVADRTANAATQRFKFVCSRLPDVTHADNPYSAIA